MPMPNGAIWFENVGPVFWGYFYADYSDEEFMAYIEAAAAAYGGPAFAGAVVTVAHSPRMPNATQRKVLAELARDSAAGTVRWHAISSDSFVARGVVTAMNWLTDKGFDERIFSRPHAALAWLSRQCPEVEPSLWDRIRDAVPPAEGLG